MNATTDITTINTIEMMNKGKTQPAEFTSEAGMISSLFDGMTAASAAGVGIAFTTGDKRVSVVMIC
jgi:hypothetical protein